MTVVKEATGIQVEEPNNVDKGNCNFCNPICIACILCILCEQ